MASSSSSPAEGPPLRLVMATGSKEEKDKDYERYFSAYASLYHQKQMLCDHKRMHAYHRAILGNASFFQGKRVLDVGAGTGILSVWCAKAGAEKVYAVEYTDMAKHAKSLVKANGVEDVVEVLQTSIEEADLGGAVDIIVSEWMGYFLLRESMLDSVIRARDRWLKPDGLMFPSHTTMMWSIVQDEEDRLAKQQEYIQSKREWHRLKRETDQFYDVDLSVLEDVYEEEQREFYLKSSFWAELSEAQSPGRFCSLKEFDLHTCSLEEAQGLPDARFDIELPPNTWVSGFAGWFTADFRGRAGRLLDTPVELGTGPCDGYTHWGQQVFYLPKGVLLREGGGIEGSVGVYRQGDNVRLYNVDIRYRAVQANGDEREQDMSEESSKLPSSSYSYKSLTYQLP